MTSRFIPAKVHTALWSDPGLHGLAPHSRLLYASLVTGGEPCAAGVAPLVPDRWAYTTGLTREQIDASLDELIAARKIAIDSDTGELLLTDFVALTGRTTYFGSNGGNQIARALAEIISPTLRAAAGEAAARGGLS